MDLHVITPEVVEADYDYYPGLTRLIATLSTLARSKEAAQAFQDYTGNVHTDAAAKITDIVSSVSMTSRGACTRLVEMFNEYNDALMRRGIIADCRTFRDLCTIDVSKALDELYNDSNISLYNESIEFCRKMKILSLVPCFTSGICVTTDRLSTKWDITAFSTEKNTLTLSCSTYATDNEKYYGGHDVPYMDFSFDVGYYDLDFDTRGYPDMPVGLTNITSLYSVSELYTAISPKKFKWNKDERFLWSHSYVRMAKYIDSISETETPYDAMLGIINNIIAGFLVTNMLLYKNRKPRHRTKTNPVAIPHYNPSKQHEPREMNIDLGPVKITGVRSTREIEAMRQYQVATWGVRGHIRTYKSGKTRYVRPYTSHRRCLAEYADADPASTTIQVGQGDDTDG